MKKKATTISLVVGVLAAAAGLLWWYLFYGEAVNQMEYATFADVGVCLYSYTESCEIVNNSVALLADTAPYNPAVFLSGVVLAVAGFLFKFVFKRKAA